MSGQHRLAPSPELLKQWRIVRWLLAATLAGIALFSWYLITAAGSPSKPSARGAGTASQRATVAPVTPGSRATVQASGLLAVSASDPGWLVPGSDPRVLPGPLLIADKGNNRLLIIDPNGRNLWEFPRPGDLSLGEVFRTPDDAFFTPDGKQIIATQRDDDSVRVIDVAKRRIVYTYGTSGVPGSGGNQLNKPEGALMLPGGDIIIRDVKNCRIIMIPKGTQTVSKHLGQTGVCVPHPPQTLGSPSGLLPMANGHYLLSEAIGSWITEISLSGEVIWSTQLPGVTSLADANEIGPNRYLTVDQRKPGQVLTFDRTGKVLWSYAPTGELALNMPSLALPLSKGEFMVSDSGNHRVIVLDPVTKAVLWQYGQTQAAGAGPGSLNNPVGLDLYPPNSLLVTHAKTMGTIPR
jgi:outer membrane protein assembly factor BamB